VINGGDAGSRDYYGDIVIDDLQEGEAEDRVVLNMQDQQRYFEGGSNLKGKRKMDDRVKTDRFLALPAAGSLTWGSLLQECKEMYQETRRHFGDGKLERVRKLSS
jgi:hypothetical protein